MEGGVSLLDITDVVLQNHLFPLLCRNDLLRLRRVSKKAKQVAEEHLGLHCGDNPQEVEISDNPDSSRNLTAFLKMGIACGRIYLINASGVKFFELPEITEFLEKYGNKITHLRVLSFYALASQPEMDFYNALTSLRHLTLENVDATPFKCKNALLKMPDGGQVPRPFCPVASTFKQLKTLKFGHVKTASKYDHDYWVVLLYSCRDNLETIGHPLHDYIIPPAENPLGYLPPDCKAYAQLTHVFTHLNVYVLDWEQKIHRTPPKLQFYDFENFRDIETNIGSGIDFVALSMDCRKHGVKLLNVDAELFAALGKDDELLEEAAEMVVSLVNLSVNVFRWELPRLEKLVIKNTSKSGYHSWVDDAYGLDKEPEWPALKILNMTVDGMELQPSLTREGPVPNPVEALYYFLFGEETRENLEELAIRFDEKASAEMNLPCPRAADLKRVCPNLKRLTLKGWTGTNKGLSQLWGGLKLLEELTLENCAGLGNVAFVGEDKDNPTFLKMTKLNSLTLNGLEVMPKVTDTLFSLVLRKVKLVKLFLGSRKPVKHISPTGIKALLAGDFAKSIEKFPFSGWSLAGVSAHEFQELERQFRSYYMV